MRKGEQDNGFDVYTMGFSNRGWEETIELLRGYSIERVVDIRTVPRSRHTPQFNRAELEVRLPEAGIDYIHLRALGGFRKPDPESHANAGWQNASFRGYADYMQTDAFWEALDELTAWIGASRLVYACTESVFWRCHRSLVSDALLLRDLRIGHIFTASKCEPHRLTGFAAPEGGRLTYPGLLGGG